MLAHTCYMSMYVTGHSDFYHIYDIRYTIIEREAKKKKINKIMNKKSTLRVLGGNYLVLFAMCVYIPRYSL